MLWSDPISCVFSQFLDFPKAAQFGNRGQKTEDLEGVFRYFSATDQTWVNQHCFTKKGNKEPAHLGLPYGMLTLAQPDPAQTARELTPTN